MPRPEKVEAVADIRAQIEDARAVFVTEFRGMTVKQLGALRRSLREAGATYKVVKMTLARRATDELGIEGAADHLVGPSALTFAHTDAVSVAKVLKDTAKDNERLVIKAGILAGKVIPPEQVSVLAEIEPREVLLAKIAGAAKAPLASFAGMLASFTRDAATMFSQLIDKKESGELTTEGADTPVPAAEPEAPEPAVEPEATEEVEAEAAAEVPEQEVSDAAAPEAAAEEPDEQPAEETADSAEEE